MAEVDVFVWYDSDGNITAIGTPHPDRVASVHPIAAKDRDVLRVRLDASRLERLHETYRVDIAGRGLTPHPSGSKTK